MWPAGPGACGLIVEQKENGLVLGRPAKTDVDGCARGVRGGVVCGACFSSDTGGWFQRREALRSPVLLSVGRGCVLRGVDADTGAWSWWS